MGGSGVRGLVTGQAVRYHTNGGTSIGGLADDTVYYVRVSDVPTGGVQLARTKADAISGANLIPLNPNPVAGFDLGLMPSLSDVSAIPTEGKNLVIMATVDNKFYFRIFDGAGKMVVDTDETKLTAQTQQIGDLRNQLAGLWPPHELTRSEKDRVITAVTSIVGYTPATGNRHTFTIENVEGADQSLNPASNVVVSGAATWINLGAGHGLATGDVLRYQTHGGKAIGGLADDTLYYVRVGGVPAGGIQLCAHPGRCDQRDEPDRPRSHRGHRQQPHADA